MIKQFTTLTILLFVYTQSQAQWSNRFNGQGDYSDVFHKTIVGSDGNIYAAGYTMNSDVSKDILLVKCNTAGDTLWTRQYAGAGNGPDEVFDAAIDGDGNIVLTGYQKGSGTGFDFITLKYNPAGTLLWTAIYNYSTNETDQSNVITIDAANNIYIAGQSDKDNSPVNDDDIVVIKYNSSGVEQWAKRTDGIANSTDRPAAIAVGTDNNIIVTGRSSNGNDDDYITIKYNSITGNEMWRKLYDRTHHDRATGLAIDATTGNIIVTGRSNNGDNYDFATICYNATGTIQWQQIYDYVDDDRATDVTLDSDGNIYVVGNSDLSASPVINYNITTVKYSPSGVQQFVQSIDGPAGQDDIPVEVICDNSNHIIVAGYADTDASDFVSNDIIVVAYNSSGTQLWLTQLDQPSYDDWVESMGIADDGTIYIAGHQTNIPYRDAIIHRLSNTGALEWTYVYNGIGDNSDNMHMVLRDSENNIVLGGYTTQFATDRDFLILKLGATGTQHWARTFTGNSSKQSSDDVNAIAIDNDNNIYAAGFIKNSGTGNDILVVKLNADGDSIWSYTYNNAISNETDKAIAIHVEATGSVTILGRTDADPTFISNDNILVIRLNSAGIQQWMYTYNGIGNGDDFPRSMYNSPTGEVYVVGESYNGTDMDAVLIKVSSTGAQEWVKRYDGGEGDDEYKAIQYGTDDLLYLAGTSTMTGGDLDAHFAVYQTDGSLLQENTYDQGVHGDDEVKNMVLITSGEAVLGITSHSDTSSLTLDGNLTAVSFSSDGTLNWETTYDAGANEDVGDIAYNEIQGIVITGQQHRDGMSTNDYDYITITVDASGILTQEIYNGGENDIANTLLTASNGIYVSGGSYSASGQRDIYTILYGSTPDAIHTEFTTQEITLFPNPTSGICYVSTNSTEETNNGVLQVTDLAGHIVMQQSYNQSKIYLDISKLSNGAYIVMLITDNGIAQQQIIKSAK